MEAWILACTCILFSSSVVCVAKEKELNSDNNACPIQNEGSRSCSKDLAEDSANLVVSPRTDVIETESVGIYRWVGSALSEVGNGLSTTVNNVWESAKDTGDKIYSKMKKTTLEIIEGVRQVLREEFGSYYVVESAVSTVLNTAMAPGKASCKAW